MKVLVCLTSLAMIASTAPLAVTAQSILWQDSFNGNVLNDKFWTYDLGRGENGWGNWELQTYTNNNTEVSNGRLKIEARRNGNEFTSSRINTAKKVEFLYGRVEARIKNPNVTGGLWPAFWTMGANFPEVPWPKCGELDIMEGGQGIAGEYINNRVVVAAHWWEEQENHPQGGYYALHDGKIDYSSLLYEDYHNYVMDWTSTEITMAINDQIFWRFDIGQENCKPCEEFHKPHFLLLNLAVGGGFTKGGHSSCGYSSGSYSTTSSTAASGTGSTTSVDCPAPLAEDIFADFPAAMEVDYVLIRDNGETEIFIYTDEPTSAPTSLPTSSPTKRIEEFKVVTEAPTLSPTKKKFPEIQVVTEAPTASPWDDPEDYYHDNWENSVSGSRSGKSSKGSSSKGSKGSKGSSSKGSKGKSSSYSADELEVLCSEEKAYYKGKSSKGKSSSSKGMSSSSKSSKSMKSSKGKSSKYQYNYDCGTSAQLRKNTLDSAAPSWSLRLSLSAILLLPAVLLL